MLTYMASSSLLFPHFGLCCRSRYQSRISQMLLLLLLLPSKCVYFVRIGRHREKREREKIPNSSSSYIQYSIGLSAGRYIQGVVLENLDLVILKPECAILTDRDIFLNETGLKKSLKCEGKKGPRQNDGLFLERELAIVLYMRPYIPTYSTNSALFYCTYTLCLIV